MNIKGVEDGISDEQAVRQAYPRFQVRKNYSPGGSTYRAFDGKNSKAKPISDWMKSRTKAIGQAASRLAPSRCSAAVPEPPTFSYQLAMHLTRNGADAPHMQAEINRFLYEGKWQTTQGAK